MWRERNQEHPNYRRMSYVWQQHRARFKRYVDVHGLTCQSCGGAGGDIEVVNELGGPWFNCGWCEGTGKVTRWLRGMWLSEMKNAKRSKLTARATQTSEAA